MNLYNVFFFIIFLFIYFFIFFFLLSKINTQIYTNWIYIVQQFYLDVERRSHGKWIEIITVRKTKHYTNNALTG